MEEAEKFKTSIHSAPSESNKTCLLISTTGCFSLPVRSTEIRVSRSYWELYGVVFFVALDSSQAFSDSHVAICRTAVPTVIPQGECRCRVGKLSLPALTY